MGEVNHRLLLESTIIYLEFLPGNKNPAGAGFLSKRLMTHRCEREAMTSDTTLMGIRAE